jgi:HSP20 family protein
MALTPLRRFDDLLTFGLDRELLKPFSFPSRYSRKFSPSFDIDMVENESNYVIHADIPGVTKEDINLSIEGGLLTITAERKINKENTDEASHYHFLERSRGTFTRSFSLPENASSECLRAKYENGVLEIVLNKTGKSNRHVFKIE